MNRHSTGICAARVLCASAVISISSLLIPVSVGTFASTDDRVDRLHPVLHERHRAGLTHGRSPFVIRADHGRIQVRVRTDDPRGLPEAARGSHARVRAVVGGVASVEIPPASLTGLARLPGVISVKPARAYRPVLDISTADIGVPATEGLLGGTGEGVIVAVIDTGIDFRHPDFLNVDGSSRILAAWDQTDPNGGGLGCGGGLTFGRCWSKAALDADLAGGPAAGLVDNYGHGTHVAGIAAGLDRSNGPGSLYAGVATEADLLVVRVFNDDVLFVGDLPSAYAWIQTKAAAAGKPFVINMSLGTDLGPHDGTDPDEIALDALLAPGLAGRAAAVAAGNSRNDGIHTEGTVSGGTSNVHSFDLPSYTPLSGAGNDLLFLDLWHDGADQITVRVLRDDGVPLASAITGSATGPVCTPEGAVTIDATNAPDPDNGDNQVLILLSDDGSCAGSPPPIPGGTLQIEVEGIQTPGGGQYHLWSESYLGIFFSHIRFAAAVESTLVGSPACSLQAVSVGSYVTRQCWPNADPNSAGDTCFSLSAPVGDASGYSSNGPTRDGRLKPEIGAPGEWIAAALASVNSGIPPVRKTPDGLHWTLRGTSMAAPHVAGALAVLLQLNPALDAAQARGFLEQGGREDSFTGPVPNQLFGAGKMDLHASALALLKIVSGVEMDAGGILSWPAEPHSDTYNVYRGDLPGTFPASYGSCVASTLPAAGFDDPDAPAQDAGYFYLITGLEDGIEGSLGLDSSLAQRPNASPCP
jgi:subtilisin family serine protease